MGGMTVLGQSLSVVLTPSLSYDGNQYSLVDETPGEGVYDY